MPCEELVGAEIASVGRQLVQELCFVCTDCHGQLEGKLPPPSSSRISPFRSMSSFMAAANMPGADALSFAS